MAQMQENNTTEKGGKRRSKKMGLQLDMTPLVDLLDEVKITDTRKYARVDVDETDKDLLAGL